ncbi:hypothetical protein GCM10023238_05280 [Streptomyces heliomycini]
MDPDDNVVAVFGAATRKGRCAPGRRIHAYAIFGSVEIDLSEALFDHQQVKIKSFAVFGSVEIRVPENGRCAAWAAASARLLEVATLDATERRGPVVYVDGWAVLGSVEARPSAASSWRTSSTGCSARSTGARADTWALTRGPELRCIGARTTGKPCCIVSRSRSRRQE